MPLDVRTAYREIANIEQPNPMQVALFEPILAGDSTILLKSPTGSGKTEAVIVPVLAGLDGPLPRRLFLILPTRSLVDDQIGRLERIFQHLSTHRSMALVVDTGAESVRRVWQNGQEDQQAGRHLYDGDVIVTTLDKFLYRFFGFGEEKKAYIYPFRIHYGARRSFFVFDEAHSYDDVAFTNFVDLVRAMYVKRLDVVVMTATMPPDYANELSFLTTMEFTEGAKGEALREFHAPLRPHKGKLLSYVPCSRKELVNSLIALAQEHFAPGRRVIVTSEEVKNAVAVYQALQARFGEDVLLYHGRLPQATRRETYGKLKRRDDAGEGGPGYLLVTTSAIEVGCDLDAHVLITEVCNPEQLLQRAGRCNRRGKIADAQVIVVGDRIKSYLRRLDEEGEEQYLDVLQGMNRKPLDVPAITQCIRKQPEFDYRVQMLFQMLYEYVYEGRRENKRLHDMGLVITRSWEPSVTLTTNAATMDNAVSAGMTGCSTYDPKELTENCQLFRRVYQDDGSHRYELEPVNMRGGCAYLAELILEVPEAIFDSRLGYVELPNALLAMSSRNSYKRWVAFPTSEERTKLISKGRGNERVKGAWFWYLDRLPTIEEEDEEGGENVD